MPGFSSSKKFAHDIVLDMKKSSDNSFYRDLDRAKDRGGSCNCVTLAVAFVIVLFVVEGAIFYFFKGIRVKPGIQKNQTTLDTIGGTSKIDLGNNQSQVTITQGGLCGELVKNKFAKSGEVACVISPDGVEISGKINLIAPENSSVLLVPKVESDRLKLEVSKFSVGKVSFPKSMGEKMSASATSALLKAFPELDKVTVQEVELQDGVMIIKTK